MTLIMPPPAQCSCPCALSGAPTDRAPLRISLTILFSFFCHHLFCRSCTRLGYPFTCSGLKTSGCQPSRVPSQ